LSISVAAPITAQRLAPSAWNSRSRAETGVRAPAAGAHLCFRAPSRCAVQEFHTAALSAGGRDDGAPGLRPQYHADYYGAFVLDPDGHRIEAVCHAPETPLVLGAG
jgi:catechol 2,3-dioxygenase-like lactoylglutathione lyase family enzyme